MQKYLILDPEFEPGPHILTEAILNNSLPQREYDRAKADRIIANEMTSRSMSDAKWVRMLTMLSETIDPSIAITAKLVWDSEPRSMWIHDAVYDFDFYATAMEAMIGGYPRGWYDYKEIEWIMFSGSNEVLKTLKNRLDSVGMFDVELSSTVLQLFAYRRA